MFGTNNQKLLDCLSFPDSSRKSCLHSRPDWTRIGCSEWACLSINIEVGISIGLNFTDLMRSSILSSVIIGFSQCSLFLSHLCNALHTYTHARLTLQNLCSFTVMEKNIYENDTKRTLIKSLWFHFPESFFLKRNKNPANSSKEYIVILSLTHSIYSMLYFPNTHNNQKLYFI